MNPGRGKEPGEVGFDLRTIPVCLGSEPVRRIRASAELWQEAAYRPPFGTRLGEEPLPEIGLALTAEVPGLQGWTGHFPDRGHDKAEYLLDPALPASCGPTPSASGPCPTG